MIGWMGSFKSSKDLKVVKADHDEFAHKSGLVEGIVHSVTEKRVKIALTDHKKWVLDVSLAQP